MKLWHILREHRRAIDGVAEVVEVTTLCRKIAAHYNKERNGEFKVCKEDLEKLLDNLTALPFADLSLDRTAPPTQNTSQFSTCCWPCRPRRCSSGR